MSIMELEETEVKLCLSAQIAQELIKEASEELAAINRKYIIRSIDY